MKIKKLNLYTNKLELEKAFYSDTLGFELLEEEDYKQLRSNFEVFQKLYSPKYSA